jgi:glycosyltransferase involved in cell wall biosynthesis
VENYSVLMSVYYKEDPENFEQAICSILNQTHPTNDFVIVCDGPLTDELDAILDKYSAQYSGILNVVRLPQNVGIGAAANEGLKVCINSLVAKMDADDIAVSQRCELQCKKFGINPNITVLGGLIEEFDSDPDIPFSIREVPVNNNDIRSFAKRRQPFNNQTVMYRREAVDAVGGYSSLRRNEDYDLYIRLLNAGYYCENLPTVLVKVRVNNQARARRSSWSTFDGSVRSRWKAYRIGYSSLIDLLFCFFGAMFVWICPSKLQHFIYQNILRKKV